MKQFQNIELVFTLNQCLEKPIEMNDSIREMLQSNISESVNRSPKYTYYGITI